MTLASGLSLKLSLPRPFVIGVTGGLGAGKSLVAHFFVQHGALLIDADKVVHDLLKVHGAGYRAVAKMFGRDFVSVKGVDRVRLAATVFADPLKLRQLTDILHPLALKEVVARVRRNARRKLIVLDAPLLIEAGWNAWVHCVVVVKANRGQQITRACERLGITPSEARRRLSAQMPFAQKVLMADYVIDNRGTPRETKKEVQAILRKLGGDLF